MCETGGEGEKDKERNQGKGKEEDRLAQASSNVKFEISLQGYLCFHSQQMSDLSLM